MHFDGPFKHGFAECSRQALSVFFGGDERRLAPAREAREFRQIMFIIRMMIREKRLRRQLAPCALQRGEEFFRPPNAGKGHSAGRRRV